MRSDQMHLAFSAHLTGIHSAGWLHPSTKPDSDSDIAAYRELAAIAERGKFDLFFMADAPGLRMEPVEDWSRVPWFTNVLEPLTALSALAGSTSRIGLGGTATTTFTEPFNIARQFASLDHITGGRAAWNVVTTATDFAARNFGLDRMPPHAERYRRAADYVRLVLDFWNTWDDDAFIYDRENVRFFHPERLHPVRHESEHFSIRGGGLNIGRTPQGRPVIVQAGASNAGRELAAETADVVFGTGADLESARAYYDDVKGRMARYGREPSELKILSGLAVVVGETEEEAHDKFAEVDELLLDEVARVKLAMDLEIDLSPLPFDEPVPPELIPEQSNLHTQSFARVVELIHEKNPTIRELSRLYRGPAPLRGDPRQIADVLEERFRQNSCDGFMLQFVVQPAGLEDFVDLVVPELQRRGLFRTDYTGSTLREHLGLERPADLRTAAQASPRPVATTA